MAHCPFERLGDIPDVLAAVRTLERVIERKPGIFYMKGLGFLHFHVKGKGADERRWADVRDGQHWGSPIDLPFEASKASQNRFMKEVRQRHRRTVAALDAGRKV